MLMLLAGCATPPPADREPARPEPHTLSRPAAPSAVRRLLEELLRDDIEARERAEADLLALGESAEAELCEFLNGRPPAELKARVQAILARIEVRPTLPSAGRLGDVAVEAMHSFAWRVAPRGDFVHVSTVWSIRNTGSAKTSVRIARARVVHKGVGHDVRITGTKGDEEPDPAYELDPGMVRKPALKMPECPRMPAGDEVYAVLDFTDGQRVLRLRSDDAAIEKNE
jgi:hypothetical protein